MSSVTLICFWNSSGSIDSDEESMFLMKVTTRMKNRLNKFECIPLDKNAKVPAPTNEMK